jgi:hypothetical protein
MYWFGLAGCPPPGTPLPGAPPPLRGPPPLGGPLPGVLLRAVFIAVDIHCWGVVVVVVVVAIVEELVVGWTMMVSAVCVTIVMSVGSMGVLVLIGLLQMRAASLSASLSCSLVESLLDKDATSFSESCFCLPLSLGVKGVLGSELSCKTKLSRLVGCGSKSKSFTLSVMLQWAYYLLLSLNALLIPKR